MSGRGCCKVSNHQISKDKKRVVAIVPKDLAERLEQIAYDNGRMSVSAYIVKLIDDEVKRVDKGRGN